MIQGAADRLTAFSLLLYGENYNRKITHRQLDSTDKGDGRLCEKSHFICITTPNMVFSLKKIKTV